jgi:uncharacterized protein YebE (UPF0316 family)
MTDSALWPLVGVPLLIFLARTTDVSLGTVRIILVARGHRKVAPLVGFFEILVWLVALAQVMQHLDRPVNYLAFGAGFAAGTYLGMWLESKLALGLVAVRVIATQDASALIEALKRADMGVTSLGARGVQGRVRLLFTVIRRKDLPRAMELIQEIQPKAFVSVTDVRTAREGYLPGALGPGGLGWGVLDSLRFWERRKKK